MPIQHIQPFVHLTVGPVMASQIRDRKQKNETKFMVKKAIFTSHLQLEDHMSFLKVMSQSNHEVSSLMVNHMSFF